MYVSKNKQIKRIFIFLFLICFFVLCSCHKQVEEPKEGFSITFVTNGHGEQLETLEKQTNLPDPLPVLSEEGWKFNDWFKDNETFKDRAKPNEKIEDDIILYAKWVEDNEVNSKQTFPVNYEIDKNQGRLEGEVNQIVEQGKEGTPVTVIPNPGYKFLGWSVYGSEPEGENEFTRVEKNVQGVLIVKAILQGPITCDIQFKAKEGGTVTGTLKQSVLYGDKGEPVTAIPDEGFRFVKWSDGETEAERTNESVTYRWGTVYAEFERYKRDFKLEYNEATSKNELTDYTFYLDDMEKEQYLPVPQREGYEFMGWYSDWFHTTKVTDETGKMIVGREWFTNDYLFYEFTNPDMKLFAKWKPIKEVPVYKILMIYVTEIHAALETSYYGTIQVDYVMNEIEREHCKVISLRMEEYLEAILNGTVDFQVDTYFTKEPLHEDSFDRGSTVIVSGGKIFDDFGIDTQRGKISEVNDILDNYSSVMTLFSLNDDESKLHITAGSSGAKYGEIHLDYDFFQFKDNPENTFNFSYPGVYNVWIGNMGTYIHEFTHTVELQLSGKDNYGIHNALSYLGKEGVSLKTEFDYLYSYLRNEFNIGDRNVGIPYEFWTGEYEKE
ncbi:MAG: InlB B-repeat-containing protein [Anaeroplasmataceae bacterium]|nr:InlB B-repeat-containing protein [Anaeroplasmataceae bacterium]